MAHGEWKDRLMYDDFPARLYDHARYLPRSNAHGVQGDASPTRPTVLVVDDQPTIRQLLSLLLEEAGYRVHEAPDGGPALQQLRASPKPMVVLLDMEMPGVDGAQVMRAVAVEQTIFARHAFVLVTANAATLPPAFATLLRQLGVPVIPKPFDVDELLEAVAQAVVRLNGRPA